MPQRRNVAILVEASGGFNRQVLRGIAAYRHAHARWQIVAFGRQTPRRPRAGPAWDGLIVYAGDRTSAEEIRALKRPAVNLSHRFATPGLAQVVGNDVAMGRLAAAHFLARGFRRFAYCGTGRATFSERRGEGFASALREAGFACERHRPALDEPDRWHWTARQQDLARWLASLETPVGVMAAHDGWGIETLEACARSDLRVPEDVAVVGVDNDEVLCDMADPPLSSVDRNIERQGYEAAALLDRMMDGAPRPEAPVLIEPVGVVGRRSSETLAIDDPDVSAAMRFIHDHAAEDFDVEAVVDATAVSRRTLEYRFKERVGRTLGQEIRRVHVERARQLLRATDMTLYELARAAGFKNESVFSHIFRRETGLAPGAYRKRHRLA